MKQIMYHASNDKMVDHTIRWNNIWNVISVLSYVVLGVVFYKLIKISELLLK